jgi:sulfur dioxygenase
MLFRQLFDYETYTYTYLLADEESKEAVLIDPVREQVERDAALINQLGLKLKYTLETHVHADHVTGGGLLRVKLGSKTILNEKANSSCSDLNLSHGSKISFGKYELEIRSTPGHTDGCSTFVFHGRDDLPTMAFTGDALFVRGCGRTDFQQGSAEKLFKSIHEQIYTLPDQTIVYPGHDYKGHQLSTVAEEKQFNPRIKMEIKLEDFCQTMNNLNLPNPKHIHEAVPANLNCGLKGDEMA